MNRVSLGVCGAARMAQRRSPHGTEVPLMFGNLTPQAFIGSDPALPALVAQTMQAWINFAHSGNPSQ
jgi:para-nitrobenzyl esterase